ncbi:MAG: spore coat associated protein CotJA [Lachnospiraceae bacterium]|nr:spore coat associated protein CotJA [Lachnospiraceae bacterium]
MSECKYQQQMDQFPVGSAYVPWQHFDQMFDNLEKAFKTGTIFPELDKPFEGRRCVK